MEMCAYCRELFDTGQMTRDHVPPKALFERPRPSNLLTVASCRRCNEAFGPGDELLKTMAALSLWTNPKKTKIIAGAMRGVKRPSWWRSKFLDAFRHAGAPVVLDGREAHFVKMPGEISETIDRSLTRIVRGLLFSTHPHFDTRPLKFEVRQMDLHLKVFHEIAEGVGPLRFNHKVGNDDFQAAWDIASDSSSCGICAMCFHSSLTLVCIFGREELFDHQE